MKLQKYEFRLFYFKLAGTEKDIAGSGLVLEPMCPNPLKSSAVIAFAIEQNSWVLISVYDIGGKLAASFEDEPRGPDHYLVIRDTGDTCPGVYFYRPRTGRNCITRKCIVP